MSRIEELNDKGLNSLSEEEREEYNKLAAETQEFESHDHKTT